MELLTEKLSFKKKEWSLEEMTTKGEKEYYYAFSANHFYLVYETTKEIYITLFNAQTSNLGQSFYESDSVYSVRYERKRRRGEKIRFDVLKNRFGLDFYEQEMLNKNILKQLVRFLNEEKMLPQKPRESKDSASLHRENVPSHQPIWNTQQLKRWVKLLSLKDQVVKRVHLLSNYERNEFIELCEEIDVLKNKFQQASPDSWKRDESRTMQSIQSIHDRLNNHYNKALSLEEEPPKDIEILLLTEEVTQLMASIARLEGNLDIMEEHCFSTITKDYSKLMELYQQSSASNRLRLRETVITGLSRILSNLRELQESFYTKEERELERQVAIIMER